MSNNLNFNKSYNLFDGIDEVHLGFIALFLPPDIDMSDPRYRKMTDIMMAVAGRFERQTIVTASPSLQWCVVVRRPSIVNMGNPSYAVVQSWLVSDISDAGRFLRRNLFDILANDGRMIVRYEPPIPEPEDDSSNFCTTHFESSLAKPCQKTIETTIRSFEECSVPRIETDLSERNEVSALEREREKWVDALKHFAVNYINRFHEMPPLAEIENYIRGKLMIDAPATLSRVMVNGDFRIFLPEFNELELRMTPLVRTLYIFFLAHPEGVILKDMTDYQSELTQIYSLIKPGADDQLAERSIADLISPCGDSLQQKLSMSRRAIRQQILDPSTAGHYMITGRPGQPYRIPLPPEKILLPRILINS